MTQNINATSPSGNPEQPPQPTQAAKLAKSTKTKPQKNLYEPYRMPMIFWRLIRVIVRIIVAIIFDVHTVGRQNVPETGPLIIASNHLSWADVPLIPAFLKRRVVYMAKEETFKARGGWLVRLLGAFPVKRGEADRQSLRAAEEQLKAGRILSIFPEGTRSKIHTLGQAHAGLGMIALRSGAPVLPVAIYGSEKSFTNFRPRITIIYGEPMILTPKGRKITREDIDQSTEQVMLRISSMLPPEYRGVYAEKLAAAEATIKDTPAE
ncbi:MAG TPA: lysophospholipid acyltransferase family protein [Ktedonobacteraceae bacterium]|nr:lysophospholipid acyltransferase family protein [Ktedonobacteraceae bacterium]